MRLIIQSPIRVFAGVTSPIIRQDGALSANLDWSAPGAQPIDFESTFVYSNSAQFGIAASTSIEPPTRDSEITVGEFENHEAVEAFLSANPGVTLFTDLPIDVCQPYCGKAAVGNYEDVARLLGAAQLHANDATGDGVRIAILDRGIDGTRADPSGNALNAKIDKTFRFPQNYRPGSRRNDPHGAMCAFDALIAAPDATFLDVGFIQMPARGLATFLSNALQAYQALIDFLAVNPGPLIVNNSWGLYDVTGDEVVGTPGNYSANRYHPLTAQIETLAGMGADILFAAGNCGGDCPDARCKNTIGSGNILGAASSSLVTCVAAVTVASDRLGYSSQGPGRLDPNKPDIAAYSHFLGRDSELHSGTSASCPVAAGVVAALRSKFTTVPSTVVAALRGSARQIGAAVWNQDIGFGILEPLQALPKI